MNATEQEKALWLARDLVKKHQVATLNATKNELGKVTIGYGRAAKVGDRPYTPTEVEAHLLTDLEQHLPHVQPNAKPHEAASMLAAAHLDPAMRAGLPYMSSDDYKDALKQTAASWAMDALLMYIRGRFS